MAPVMLLACGSGFDTDNANMDVDAGEGAGGMSLTDGSAGGAAGRAAGGNGGAAGDGGVTGTGGLDGTGGAQSGGNGGVAAGGAGAGGIGAGGISSGGSPSQTIDEPCETVEQANGSLDPEERERTIGDNGTFEDACDADGNLIEYVCETGMMCEGFPNPACTTFLTGNVIEELLNCSGHCVDGTCEARCPAVDDVVRYLSVDAAGNPELLNVTDGRKYSCDLLFDGGGCTSIVADTERVITSLGLRGGPCTGADFGNIGTSDPQQCSYRCDITP